MLLLDHGKDEPKLNLEEVKKIPDWLNEENEATQRPGGKISRKRPIAMVNKEEGSNETIIRKVDNLKITEQSSGKKMKIEDSNGPSDEKEVNLS